MTSRHADITIGPLCLIPPMATIMTHTDVLLCFGYHIEIKSANGVLGKLVLCNRNLPQDIFVTILEFCPAVPSNNLISVFVNNTDQNMGLHKHVYPCRSDPSLQTDYSKCCLPFAKQNPVSYKLLGWFFFFPQLAAPFLHNISDVSMVLKCCNSIQVTHH